MRSAVHVRYDVAVQAFRNAEIVFSRESLNEVAWDPITERGRNERDYLHLISPNGPCRKRHPGSRSSIEKRGWGSREFKFLPPMGASRNLRTLNPYVHHDRTLGVLDPSASLSLWKPQPATAITVQSGSVFLEEWAYLPFRLGTGEGLSRGSRRMAGDRDPSA
jgi:hypothetical protein